MVDANSESLEIGLRLFGDLRKSLVTLLRFFRITLHAFRNNHQLSPFDP